MKTLTILGILAICLAAPAYAGEQIAFSEEVARELVPLRNNVQVLRDMSAAGVVSAQQAQTGATRYLEIAAKVAGRQVTVEELLAISVDQPVKLTGLQKFAGYITFVNTMWVFAIIVGVTCFIYLFGRLIVEIAGLFLAIPAWFYEFLLYAFSLTLILKGDYFRPGVGQYVALTGCLAFAGALIISGIRLKLSAPGSFFLILTAVWGFVALLYSSSLIGFFAVIALMGALGFFVAIHPLVYVIGFKDEDSVGRATAAAFCLLAAFVALQIFGIPLAHLSVFQPGVLFMGSFVGFLGLLIASTRWYPRRYPWPLFQLIAIAAGIGALYFGTVYQLPELAKIGGTFFALYLLEKFCEVPVEGRVGYACLGLIGSGAVYWFCLTVKNNPDFFRPYLFF